MPGMADGCLEQMVGARNGWWVPGMADGCQGWVVGGRGQAQAAHRDIRVTSSAG